ncbi:MAG: cryptochrome/photolyase family protein [Spirosomaceae bacterium]|nr:cryptochrome/photolyase family protein [Spirosomataceae bacterium]
MTQSVAVVFPHQLFADLTLLRRADEVYLVEEFLFFRQYKFHQQKLVFHRASMKYYEDFLRHNGLKISYVEATDDRSDIRTLLPHLTHKGVSQIHYFDVCDDWLEKRLRRAASAYGLTLQKHPSASFINVESDLKAYFEGKKRYFQTDFYVQQRKKLRILVDENLKPTGDKWSFDAENRLKYPKTKIPPPVQHPVSNPFYKEATAYVKQHFSNHLGRVSPDFIYPTTHAEAERWLEQFLQNRFAEFGEYEDAIVAQEVILHHSVLTPMLNVGLLTPPQIIQKTLEFAQNQGISLNSLEGFVRQIIGWREFIRGVYVYKGVQERTTNFWQFKRKIPPSFYDGTTGIQPIDDTIQKVLATGYCHHIERLMLLGNFMLLCEFDPDEVYRWFMELFIDAYDWVMVPNVYGMSQFADGGLMATKPYISGSSYVLKMSNYPKAPWCEVWDGLFWRFMHTHRDFFLSNPRLGMLVKTFDKMPENKQKQHLATAEKYLQAL